MATTTVGMVTQYRKLVHLRLRSLSADLLTLLERSRRSVDMTQIMATVR